MTLSLRGPSPDGSTSKPGEVAPQIAQALDKAGLSIPVGEIENGQKPFDSSQPGSGLAEDGSPKRAVLNSASVRDSVPSASMPLASSVIDSRSEKTPKPRKSVSFAEDTKETTGFRSQSNPRTDSRSPSETQRTIASSTNSIFDRKPGTKQRAEVSVYDEDEDRPFNPVIPDNESPEDAALRRQMIQYNLKEINPIVAELDLEEGELIPSDAEGSDDVNETSSIEEDEDQFGRTKKPVLSKGYLNEMKNLQQRLANAGPNGKFVQPSNTTKDTKPDVNAVTAKGVRFAENLDIKPPPADPQSDKSPATPESNGDAKNIPKPIHVPKVIERPYTASTSTAAAAEPDELDPVLVRQEVSTEYHRMRNRMIQKQGGFMATADDGEDGEAPVPEEPTPRKVSRFKAARLRQQGSQ